MWFFQVLLLRLLCETGTIFNLELLILHYWHRSLLGTLLSAFWALRFSNLTDGNKHFLPSSHFLRCTHPSVLCWMLTQSPLQIFKFSLWCCLLSGTLWTIPTLFYPDSQFSLRESVTRLHTGFFSLCHGLETLKAVSWANVWLMSFVSCLPGITVLSLLVVQNL